MIFASLLQSFELQRIPFSVSFRVLLKRRNLLMGYDLRGKFSLLQNLFLLLDTSIQLSFVGVSVSLSFRNFKKYLNKALKASRFSEKLRCN